MYQQVQKCPRCNARLRSKNDTCQRCFASRSSQIRASASKGLLTSQVTHSQHQVSSSSSTPTTPSSTPNATVPNYSLSAVSVPGRDFFALKVVKPSSVPFLPGRVVSGVSSATTAVSFAIVLPIVSLLIVTFLIVPTPNPAVGAAPKGTPTATPPVQMTSTPTARTTALVQATATSTVQSTATASVRATSPSTVGPTATVPVQVAATSAVQATATSLKKATVTPLTPTITPQQLRFVDKQIVTAGNSSPVPLSIVQGSDGNMWFTDDANEIGKVTPQGAITEVALTNAGSGPDDPTGITRGPDGSIWFTMRSKAFIGRVNLNVPFTVSAITYVNLPSSEKGGTAIATGPDGNLWYVLAGTTNDAIIGCRTIGGNSCGDYKLGHGVNPSSIISAGGKLWFTEFAGQKIGWITPGSNATLRIIPLHGQPFNMASEPDGEIWFTEPNVNKLGHINASGKLLEEVPLTNLVPESIAIGPDHTIWLTVWPVGATSPGGKIENRSSDGKNVISYPSFPTPCFPPHGEDEYYNGNGITVAPDGHIWFTEYQGAAMAKIGHNL